MGESENLSALFYRGMGKPIEKNLSVQNFCIMLKQIPIKNLSDLLNY